MTYGCIRTSRISFICNGWCPRTIAVSNTPLKVRVAVSPSPQIILEVTAMRDCSRDTTPSWPFLEARERRLAPIIWFVGIDLFPSE